MPATTPTVTTTTPATGITATGATIAGNISSLGSPTASSSYGFIYSTTASTAATLQLAQAGVTSAQVGTTGATVGNYSTTLSSLSNSTTYYYRAYVTNSTGTGYGTVESFATLAAPTATITTGAITPATIQAGNDVTVDYATTGTFTGGNVFSAELSNSAGSFASGTTVLTTTGSTATSLTVTIPGATAAGSAYRIRVNGSSPVTTGSASTNALTVTPIPPTIGATTAAPTSVYGGGSVTLTYTTTSSFNGGNVFTAELSDVAGNFPGTVLTPTASSAGSLTVTIPVGTAAGAGYVLRVLASNPATTGPASNAITVNAGVFEPFELASLGAGYVTPAAPITEQTGPWTFFQAANGTTSALGDAFNGVRSVRIRGGGYAQYTKANGVGSISLLASAYNADANGSFTLQYSVDGGATFLTVAGTPTSLPAPGPTHTFANPAYSYMLNVTGSVVVRIGTTNTSLGNNPRIDIDDVTITDYLNPAARLTASPISLSLSATTGQVATGSYNLLGQNLPTGTMASISSNDPAVLVSVDGGATYVATATSAAASASGNLVQVVLVQFTAPAVAGTTNATIANDIASLGLSAPVAVTGTALPVVSYTWTGTTSTSWSNATNWTPNRTTLSTTDVLVFNGTTTAAPTVDLDYVTAQTIGQLQFSNAVVATFTNTGDRTLNLSHLSSGADFILPAGNTLTVFNPSASTTATGLTIQLATGGKATIGGTLVFDAATLGTFGTGAHRLQGTTANGIEFVSGSIFRAGANFSGNAFGTTGTANSVLFRNGSRYEQLGGGNPFALSQPASITTLEAASLFYVGPGITIPISMSGRTYGSLEYDLGTGVTNNTTGGSAVTIAGNLITTSGTIGVNVQGNVLLKGNVLVNGSSTLAFAASSGSVQFVGSTTQTIGGTAPAGALTFGASPIMLVNNAAGVVLARAIALNKLTLTSGLLRTDAANLLTLANPATIGGGSSSSFVNGPLARVTGAGAATTLFPIGKGTAYRPLTLNAAAQTSTTTYTGEVLNTSARTTGVDAPLDRVSNIRYSTLTPDVQPTGFSGTLTMEFGADDYVTDPQDITLVMAKRDGAANWFSIGRSSATGTAGSGNVAGTLTSGVFTSFSDFALASTAAAVGNSLGSNSLPVELTAFSAQRQADKSVSVKWATASERNSARFEVQRSLDGREFATFATAVAQGNSTHATAYAALDKVAPAGTLYYRLRQVDRDGSSSFSPVAIVAASGEVVRVLLYPNPAHSTLRFVAPTAQAYRVLNQLGQPLLHGTTEAGPAAIAVETLPTGLYFLELQTAAGRVVQKFEKE